VTFVDLPEIEPLDRFARFPSADHAAWYLAAMIDGEGYVTAPDSDRSSVVISNTERSIIDATTEALDLLDVSYRVSFVEKDHDVWRDAWVITIGRRSEVVKLSTFVRLQSVPKSDRLAAIVARQPRSLSKDDRPIDEVVRLYYEDMKSTNEIGAILGWDGETISRWLRESGYQIRDKSEGQRIRWRRDGDGSLIDEAERLYLDERLSTHAIADRLNKSSSTIRRWLADRGVMRSRGSALSIRNSREWADGSRSS
jgi:hypothetical protein